MDLPVKRGSFDETEPYVGPLDVVLDRRQSFPAIDQRYGSRRPSFCKTIAPCDVIDTSIEEPPVSSRNKFETTWKPSESDAYLREKKNNKNVLDRKSLYAIRGVNLAGRDLHFLTHCPSYYNDPTTTNVQHLVEKNYINNSRLTNATAEKFPKVILRRFHRLSHVDDEVTSYGMPRPPSVDLFNAVIDTLKREPSIVNIDNYPVLQEPVNCSRSDQFCEILGPSSCQGCIENTNRHIGEELQHMSFPTIAMTPNKLIYPRLAKLLKEGHKMQVRRKRMREMGMSLPPDLFKSMKRKETSLSSSTCKNCKKPIAADKEATKKSEKHRSKEKKVKTARV